MDLELFSVAVLASVMGGRTAAVFRCPCTDAWAPPRTSYWVELVGLPGFPALIEGEFDFDLHTLVPPAADGPYA